MGKVSITIFVAILVAAVVGGTLWRTDSSSIQPHQKTIYFTGSYEGNEWFHNYDGYQRALSLSEEHRAPIFIYTYTDWCANCKKFVDELLPHPDVEAALKRFIKLKLNPEDGPKEEALGDDWGIRGYPNLFVQPGLAGAPVIIRAPFILTKEGWQLMNPEQFLTVLSNHGLTDMPPIETSGHL